MLTCTYIHIYFLCLHFIGISLCITDRCKLPTKPKAELHLQQARDVLRSAVLFDQGPGQLVVEGHDLGEAQRSYVYTVVYDE